MPPVILQKTAISETTNKTKALQFFCELLHKVFSHCRHTDYVYSIVQFRYRYIVL